MHRYNPFRPGSIVTPGMFTGRLEESRALEGMLFNTKHGNPHHFLVHGERGIGKSSLLFVHEAVAAGRITSWEENKFNFLTVSAVLEPSDTYESIIRKLGSDLRRKVEPLSEAKKMAKSVWDFVKRWEVMGVRYNSVAEAADPSELLDELVFSYARTCQTAEGVIEGILILIDEADKPPPSANLGALLKGFAERLTKQGCGTIAIGLAGLSTVIDTLRLSHESSPRMFTSFHLKPLSVEERIEVIDKGLKEAAEKNEYETKITDDAAKLIAGYSEGYPHFIQQFAYCAFDSDTDRTIDQSDVQSGAWGEHGAFQQLGAKYFEDLYFEKIGSDDYRQVLRAMADHLDGWVTKEDIRDAVKLKPHTLNNALSALKARRIILTHPGNRGVYRLPLKSFAAWIKGYTNVPKAAIRSSRKRKDPSKKS